MNNEICQAEMCEKQAKACEQHFLYIEKVVGVKFEAIDKAMVLATEEMKRRLQETTNVKDQLSRQADTFIDVNYYRMEHGALTKEVELLRDWKNIQVGKSASTNLMAALSLMVSFIMAVLHFFPGLR